MNKWRKILSETDLSHLSQKQRYWRMVAYLRLSETGNALKTYDQGSLNFKQDSLTQITLAEIYLKTKQESKSTETLELCYEKTLKDKQFNQWVFVAKRIQNKSTKLLSILNSVKTQKIPINLSYKDWVKCIQLSEYQSSAEAHLQLMESCIKNNSLEDLENHCIKALQKTSFNSFQHHNLYNLLKNKVSWEFMTSTLFQYANRETNNRELLWRTWLKHCPNSTKATLQQKMQEFLYKKPDIYLEKLLKKTS